MNLLDRIKNEASKLQKRIVLPEGLEDRTLKAADEAIGQSLAKIILLGSAEVIIRKAQQLNLSNIGKAQIIDPTTSSDREKYANLMVELRGKKGLTKEKALELLNDPLYFGVLMIKCGDADGEVAGADNATGDVLRPAFQFIKTKPGISVVSGAFLMFLSNPAFGDNGLMVFADCAVNPAPNEDELAEIAASSAETARKIAKIEPRIAMLSFSTKGSASHEAVTKVAKATEIAKAKYPGLQIEGEIQADAAIIPSIGQKKAPGSAIAGHANVLVFPTLDAGNISYKLVQRMAGAEAVGPVLQGLAAPINDLSRGCSVSDIVNLIAITANQAQE